MVLVSILGDFHSSILPLFFEFKDKISKHIIVYDDSKYNIQQSAKIINAQQYFLEHFEKEGKCILDYQIIPVQIKEDVYEEIIQCYDNIVKHELNASNIYLNATDGLSSIAIVLSNKLLQNGSNVLAYDRYANTYNLHTANSMTKHKVTHILDIKNHLKLKGYEIINFTNGLTLKKRKQFIQEITKNLQEFKLFTKDYKKKDKRGYYRDLLHKLGNTEEHYVRGGIFEEYIYWLIKDNFEVDDIMTCVTIQFEENVVNEIDILIMKDNHLHTIECKFTDNFKTTEYIYKTDSIIDYIDDDGKGMILTVGDKRVGHQDEARAKHDNIKLYTIRTFQENDFLNAIQKWFNLKRKLNITN